MTGRLTTHGLDTARGGPAAGLRVKVTGPSGLLESFVLDAQGRAALIEGGALREGDFEILFFAGAYWEAAGVVSFFDIIPVRFTIRDASAHYHVPLVMSPFGYSTYRGG